jgi:hypothetical protein
VNCGVNVKWMEKYCNAANRGVTQDWMAFYWNLWTDGTYRYSINEITNVWEATDAANDELGETWNELVATLSVLWPGGTPKLPTANYWKRKQFTDKGDAAGVDH